MVNTRKRKADDDAGQQRRLIKSGHTSHDPRAQDSSHQHIGDIYGGVTHSITYVADFKKRTPSSKLELQNRVVEAPRNSLFCGRDTILTQIHQHLTHDGAASRDRQLRSCVLYGIGGIGKTQIANEYTYRYSENYENVFWLRAETGPELAETYSSIAASIQDTALADGSSTQKQPIKLVKHWLSNTRASWLLAFDNVRNLSDIRDYIPASDFGSIIITTQSREIDIMGSLKIPVDGLSTDDGGSLLRSVVGQEDPAQLSDQISAEVGGLPLALAQIGGYIKASQLSYQEFLEDYRRRNAKRSWYNKPGAAALNYDKTLQTVFDIALDPLEPGARNLLNCLSFLSPEDIWESFFVAAHKQPGLQFLLDADTSRFPELRSQLIERCLINRQGAGSGTTPSLSIHRSLKENLLYKLESNPAQYREAFLCAFQVLRAVTPYQSPLSSVTQKWSEYEKSLPHVLSLCSIYDMKSPGTQNLLPPDLRFAELLSDVGNYMRERGLLKDAFRVLGTAERICNTILDQDDPNPIRTQILYLLASFELNSGCPMRLQGLEHKKQILSQRQKLLDSSSRDVKRVDALQLSTAMNNLGCAYIQCEDYERAEPLLRGSLDIKLQWGDEKSLASGIAEQYKNLALVAVSRANVNEALELSEKAVRIIIAAFGDREKKAQFHLFMQASIFFNVGQHEKALLKSLDILQTKKEILDEADDQLLDSYYAVGMMQHLAGDFSNAEENLRHCLKYRNEYYEVSIARVLYRLSLVMRGLRQTKKADEFLNEARALKSKLLGEDLPGDRISAAKSIGVDLKEKDEGAVFDQMVSCWAGRYGGKQNIAWQCSQRQLRRGRS